MTPKQMKKIVTDYLFKKRQKPTKPVTEMTIEELWADIDVKIRNSPERFPGGKK